MKAAIVTATRAEYGILRPLIIKMREDTDIDLQLLVTGTHLCSEYGNTQAEIESDGIPIFRKIPILSEGNTHLAVAKTMANALDGFAEYFEDESPDCVIILGDRTEMLGICAAAVCASVPVVHLHGGELTEGAVDDSIRHAITKMSYLHFPSTEVYRKRIIQMGEEPGRVFSVGALGVENILSVPLMTEDEIRRSLNIPNGKKIVSVTFHPVTLEAGSEEEQTRELIDAMTDKSEYYYVITKANADAGGETVNKLLGEFCSSVLNAKLYSSLGMRNYLSVVKHSRFVLGNSSSGIIEAPSLGTSTVNIGTRQSGRLMADTIVSCAPKKEEIIKAMEKAELMPHTPSFIYGDGNTSDKIIKIIKEVFIKKITPMKKFYDIQFEMKER